MADEPTSGPPPEGEFWGRVGELFAQVEGMSVGQRARHLEASCAGDEALRREVESLLSAHSRAEEGFLSGIDSRGVGQLVAEAAAVPKRIGPWRIVGEIGRGGMGVVYDAVRADGQFEQVAAIKVIKRGMDSDEIVERFLRERQIVARLEHPGIARLLDGGVTVGGQPWFALERVEGVPLTRYCDERRLTIEARLRLFGEVCAAVQYAHRNLVVHRDLKPSNILVDPEGRIKLLDFGIAKALLPEGVLDDDKTRAGMRLLTPDYAAPEQVLGGLITTATDAYSLGIILYELLAGPKPFRLEGGRLTAQIRSVLDEGAARPSARITAETARERGTTSAALRRTLSGDLDTIAAKAIHRDPGRRYVSPEALWGDIERNLAGLPVRARPDSLAYRSGRFLKRHRVAAAAASLVAMSLLVGLALALWQAGVAAREGDVARQELERSAQVTNLLTDVFRGLDPNEPAPHDVTTRELLDRGLQRVRGNLEARPDLDIELLTVVGQISISLGDYPAARRILEEALGVDVGAGERSQIRRAKVLKELGVVAFLVGDVEQAEGYHRRALEIRRRWAGPDRLQLANSYNELGIALANRSRLDAAIGFYEQALEIYGEAGEETLDVLDTVYNLAIAHRKKGDYREAERILRPVVTQARERYGEVNPSMVGFLDGLGVIVGRLGGLVEAVELQRRSFELATQIWGETHPDTRLRMNNYAVAMHNLGKDREAEVLMREVLNGDLKQFGPQHRYVASSRDNLANILFDLGRLDEAMEQYERAEAIFRAADDPGRLMAHLGRHSGIWLAVGEPEKAQPQIDEALTILRRLADPERLPLTVTRAGFARAAGGLDVEAEELFVEALAAYKARATPRHPEVATVYFGLGELALERGDLVGAKERLETALEILTAALPANHWRLLEVRAALAECLARDGDPAGWRQLRDVVAAHEAILGGDHWRSLAARSRLEELTRSNSP